MQCRAIHLENGLTALLISDTQSAAPRMHLHSDTPTTDDDDGDDDESEELEEDSKGSSDDDEVDGVPDTECGSAQLEIDGKRIRKSKDSKLVGYNYN